MTEVSENYYKVILFFVSNALVHIILAYLHVHVSDIVYMFIFLVNSPPPPFNLDFFNGAK